VSAPSVRRELLGRGSVYTVASAVQAASTLLVLPIVTRLLGAEEFGVVAAGVVVTQLLALLAGVGLSSSILLEYFDERAGLAGARRLVGASFVVAIGVVLVAELTGPLWSRGFGELNYGVELRFAVWTAVPLAVLAGSQALLRAQGRPVAYVVATVAATAGGHGLGALAIAVSDGGAGAYLGGLLAGSVAGALVALVAGGVGVPTLADRDLIARSVRLGLALVPHALAMYAVLAVDRLVIEGTLGLEAAGRYQVAYLLGGAGLSLLGAVNNAWAPMVLGADDDRRWAVLAGTTRLLEGLVPTAVAVVALGAPVLLTLAAPSDYDLADLTRVTAVVAGSALPYLWYLSRAHILMFHRDAGTLARTTPMAVVLVVVANLIVLEPTGLIGAAVVTLASYGFLAWRVQVRSTRHARPPWDHASTRQAALLVTLILVLALALPTSGVGLALRGLTLLAVAAVGARRVLGAGGADMTAPTPVLTAPVP
jgi:O-antigen/teichoic acid export membrane protein